MSFMKLNKSHLSSGSIISNRTAFQERNILPSAPLMNTAGLNGFYTGSQVLNSSLLDESNANKKKGKIQINHKTTGGPIWDAHGYFYWRVSFDTNAKNGWIVQKMNNTWDETLADGSKNTKTPTPEYWEAWSVDENHQISPSKDGNHDYWQRGYTNSFSGVGTKGKWSIKGEIFHTKKDITKLGFKEGEVADAKVLKSTKTDPGNLGPSLLTRTKSGSWDSTNGKTEFSKS